MQFCMMRPFVVLALLLALPLVATQTAVAETCEGTVDNFCHSPHGKWCMYHVSRGPGSSLCIYGHEGLDLEQ